MFTKNVFRAFMITAMMIISTAIVDAQRINSEGLRKLSQERETNPAATLQGSASERNVEPAQETSQGVLLEASAQSKKATAIVGSWLDTVSVAGGPTFKSLSTYSEDGTVVFNDQGTVITDPTFPHVFSAGHGVWVHQAGNIFSQTTLQLISDLNGQLLFVNKIRQTLTLHGTGETYTVVWKATFTDPAGNLFAAFEGRSVGQRIKAEPLP